MWQKTSPWTPTGFVIPRGRWTLKRVLTRTTTLVCVVLTLEAACRLFLPAGSDIYRTTPELGRTFQPHLDVAYLDGESGNTTRLKTNSLGHRGPEWDVPKPAGVKRVMIFGDSFTAGLACDDDETFCGHLQRLLCESDPHYEWQVLNFGMNGTNPGGQMRKYQQLAADLEPDIVLVGLTPTDISELMPGSKYRGVLLFDVDDSGSLIQRPIQERSKLNETSKFYNWQKTRSNDLVKRFRSGLTVAGAYEPRHVRWYCRLPEPPEVTAAWDVIDAIAVEFAESTRTNGAELAFISMPAGYQVYSDQFPTPDSLPEGHTIERDRVDVRLAESCDAAEIPCFALAGRFRNRCPSDDSTNTDERLHLHGRGHLNARGHVATAKELFDLMHEQGWLDTNR